MIAGLFLPLIMPCTCPSYAHARTKKFSQSYCHLPRFQIALWYTIHYAWQKSNIFCHISATFCYKSPHFATNSARNTSSMPWKIHRGWSFNDIGDEVPMTSGMKFQWHRGWSSNDIPDVFFTASGWKFKHLTRVSNLWNIAVLLAMKWRIETNARIIRMFTSIAT